MFKKKSDSGKSRFRLLGLLLHPGVKIFGGIFSLLAAALFGGLQLSRRKKKKATAADARLASALLLDKLQEVRSHLADFQAWLEKQGPENEDIKETQVRYAGLKALYSKWTSHERMEEILNTVQSDPQIGMNVSNGLHELRSLNILLETLLRERLLGTPEGTKQLAAVGEHLGRAIGFFNYTGNHAGNLPGNKQADAPKDASE